MAMLAAILASAIGPYSVYADDSIPPETPSGEIVEPAEDEVVPAASGEDEAPQQTDTEEPAAPAEGEAEAAVEEPAPLAEIFEQIPDGTEVVVLNEAGEIEPLATEAAAEIIATGDPRWCPSDIAPDDGVGCTGAFGTFAELIDALEADALLDVPLFTGNGVIWVEDSYNGNDDAQIVFNGDTLGNLFGHNLVIKGGWSGTPADESINGTSLADVSLAFVNWSGNITLNDFDIDFNPADPDAAGFGLSIDTDGDVTLNNVSVVDAAANGLGGAGNGAVVTTDGDVKINISNFDSNAGNGLIVNTSGDITLDTVSASNNSLTGAYLDSCQYDNLTGLCAGSGKVTVTSAAGSNTFNNNGFVDDGFGGKISTGAGGLFIDSGGGIALDHVQANSNGLDGAYLTSADDDGTGNVSIDQSEFSENINGIGLKVLSDGNVDLTSVEVSSNSLGAILDSTRGTGSIHVTDSNFGMDNSTGNKWTGLHAVSNGSITLLDVIASYNGTNGAYLEAEGDITVTNGVFNENVHFNFPEDPGIYARSIGGNIVLNNVTANGNDHGSGAVLTAWQSGTVTVNGGNFNNNGTTGIQAYSQDGNISLTGLTASYNQTTGAYLSSHGVGNIFVNNSAFVENGYRGIYAKTNKGNINLDQVTVTGDNGVDDGAVGADNLTNIGATLKTEHGGSIFVSNSTFELNTEVGLRTVNKSRVDLVNVIADRNGDNGYEGYSNYTYGCLCEGQAPNNTNIYIDGGEFTNNTDYGMYILPGPSGSLSFIDPPTTTSTLFSGNGLGDFILDLAFVPEDCAPCACGGCCDTKPEREPKVVAAPTLPVEQNCDLFGSTVLELPNGTWADVGCPFVGFSNLEEVTEFALPGQLGAGISFVSGINMSLLDEEGNSILNEDGTVTISFNLPENTRDRNYSILFWDPTLNGGLGGWVRLPMFEAGTSFPLHPENPEDGRIVNAGVQKDGDTITFTVNFPGIFVLTTP